MKQHALRLLLLFELSAFAWLALVAPPVTKLHFASVLSTAVFLSCVLIARRRQALRLTSPKHTFAFMTSAVAELRDRPASRAVLVLMILIPPTLWILGDHRLTFVTLVSAVLAQVGVVAVIHIYGAVALAAVAAIRANLIREGFIELQ